MFLGSNISHQSFIKNDWYVWRESFSKFAKDYLWDVDKKTEIPTEDQKPSVKEDNKN